VSPTFINAGDARIKGIEIDTEAAITDTLHVTASTGYIDAFYTSIDDPTGAITLESVLPKVAKWTAHVGADYRIYLPWSDSITLRGDYTFKSRVANDADNTPELFAPGISLVDLSATYQPSPGNWSFIAGGTNITNRRYLVNGENPTRRGRHDLRRDQPTGGVVCHGAMQVLGTALFVLFFPPSNPETRPSSQRPNSPRHLRNNGHKPTKCMALSNSAEFINRRKGNRNDHRHVYKAPTPPSRAGRDGAAECRRDRRTGLRR
jgi:hypothetical protein